MINKTHQDINWISERVSEYLLLNVTSAFLLAILWREEVIFR
jgi:hypothetical protein